MMATAETARWRSLRDGLLNLTMAGRTEKEDNRMNQMFGNGDVAMLRNPYGIPFKVRVEECIQDEDGSWWYEVSPLDWDVVGVCNREVPQKALTAI